VGAFVWQTVTTAPNNTPSGWVQQGATVANSGSGTPTGFAAIDDRNASWSTILTETGYLIQAGNIVSVYNAGDFWAISSTATSIGQKVFASNLNGSIQTAAAGSIISNYTETQFYVATNNATGEVFMMSSFPQH
jgi:hypothetical protein